VTEDVFAPVDDWVVAVDCVPENGEGSDDIDPWLFCASAELEVFAEVRFGKSIVAKSGKLLNGSLIGADSLGSPLGTENASSLG
jgi:hypothetical protein